MRQLYHAYIVRCLQTIDDQQKTTWRFVLEVPTTGDRQGFASLTQLTTALAKTLAQTEQSPPTKDFNIDTGNLQ